MKILIDNGHGIYTKGKRSLDGSLLEYAQNRLLAGRIVSALQALADNGGIFLVIEATEGQSNGVSRAHSKASGIKLVEESTDAAIDIHADYVAKNGAGLPLCSIPYL